MNKLPIHYLLLWPAIFLCGLLLTACTSLDEVNDRLDKLEGKVDNLEAALESLQRAYADGKIIKSVKPITKEQGGWIVTFSDDSSIALYHGQDGVDGIDGQNGLDGRDGLTPYLLVDQDGYWCVSYDDGQHFTRLMSDGGQFIKAQGDKGDKGETGDEGVSVRVAVNSEGFYVLESYHASAPDQVLDNVVTPYHTNPAHLIYGIAEDAVSHVVTLTMQDGHTYTFNKWYAMPTSIAILTNRILIGQGTTATFEFRVNPSNAVFNYDVATDNCELVLDYVGKRRAQSDYVTPPSHYQLSKVEQVYTAEGTLLAGQYRAYVTDLESAQAYDDLVALVLTVTDGNGDKVQLSSSAVNIKYSGCLLTGFRFLKADNEGLITGDVEGTIDGQQVTIASPAVFDATRLVARFDTNGRVYVDGQLQMSGQSVNDFSRPVKYMVVSEDGETNVYTVTLSSSGLPVVYIDTPGQAPVTSKEEWMADCVMRIVNADGTVDYASAPVQLRGRGNTTWNYPKKPYALRTEKKASLLGMPQHKRWVLLASWLDRTLLRNDVAFEVARHTCLDWTPRGRFVELVMNGQHVGNYYLCEQIRVDKNRVNITEMQATDIEGDNVTGGYLVELDVHYDEVNKFKSVKRQLPYMIKSPDDEVLQPEQLAWFQNFINTLETQMYAGNWLSTRTYADQMDLNTFADWWIVHELVKNGEPGWPKSTYMYKDRLGPLKAGPVWDFDWGTFVSGTGYVMKQSIYYGRLFSDPAFVAIVKARWETLKPALESIPAYIRSMAAQLKVSNQINLAMWPIYTVTNGDETLAYDEAIERMVSAYEERLLWLDSELSTQP